MSQTKDASADAPMCQSEGLFVEVEHDLRGLLDRLPIKLGWFELIALDGFKCSVLKNGRSAEQFDVGDFAVFADCDFHPYLAADVAGFGDRGVPQKPGPDQMERVKLRFRDPRRRWG